jgi:gas vesicle protein
MLNNKVKGVVIGAVIGTLVGSLSTQLFPQRKKIIKAILDQYDWVEKAKNAGASVFDEIYHLTNNSKSDQTPKLLQGALVGVLIGAAASLFLLTSKNGGKIRNNLSKQYQNLTDKTQDFMEYLNNEFQKAPKKSVPARRTALKRKIKSK